MGSDIVQILCWYLDADSSSSANTLVVFTLLIERYLIFLCGTQTPEKASFVLSMSTSWWTYTFHTININTQSSNVNLSMFNIKRILWDQQKLLD
jgi:hypothetical protein